MLKITVYGTPGPQGSKKQVGRGIMIESSKLVKPWREAVVWAAREALAGRGAITGPVVVDIVFSLKKPASAPKKRKTYPDRKPDIDKLARSTCDALVTAGVIEDDARIVELRLMKVFAGEVCGIDVPGAVIVVKGIE